MPPIRSRLIVRASDGALWTIGVTDAGLLTTTPGDGLGLYSFILPHALRAPDGTAWIVGVDPDGILYSQNSGALRNEARFIFRASNETLWELSIGNDGLLVTTQTPSKDRPLYYCRQHNVVFLRSDYGVSHPCAVSR